jgi:predicted phage tail protein
MIRVHCHGALVPICGAKIDLAVRDPAEAIRAICANFPSVRPVIQGHDWRLVAVKEDDERDLDARALLMPLTASDLHLIPMMAGAKNGGGIKTIIGVTLIVAAIAAGQFEVFGAVEEPGMLGVDWGTNVIDAIDLDLADVARIGAMLALGGISQMLTSTPKIAPRTDSFLVGGVNNESREGSVVPLVFGRVLTGGVPISLGIETLQLNPNAAADPSPAVPSAPSLSILHAPSRVQLSWSAGSAVKFQIWRSSDSGSNGNALIVVQGAGYIDAGVSAGQTWTYRLRAGTASASNDVNSVNGWSDFGPAATITVS